MAGMRGWRTAVAALLVGALTAGCHGGREPSQPTASAGATDPTSALDLAGHVPGLDTPLQVRLASGLQVFGLGCRRRTYRDACAADETKTYTWLGKATPVTVTSVSMRLNADHGAWVVRVRFAPHDLATVQAVADNARGMGGFALLLNAGTGDALQAVPPLEVARGRITVRNLGKPDAWDLVSAYVTAATTR
jgi:hypothetical protein